MIGPIFAVGILAYITGESPEPGVDATDFAIMLIGLVLGNQVTPEILNHAEKWPASMLLLLLKMILILFTLERINQQLLGMDTVSAYLAGAPGNLATAIAIAHQLEGSISQVAIYHSLRLAFLTVITPSYFLCSRDSYHITSFWKLRFRDLDFAVGLDLVDDTGSKKT